MMGSMMQDLAFAIPGVDEAMSFAEIMKYVDSRATGLRTYAEVIQRVWDRKKESGPSIVPSPTTKTAKAEVQCSSNDVEQGKGNSNPA